MTTVTNITTEVVARLIGPGKLQNVMAVTIEGLRPDIGGEVTHPRAKDRGEYRQFLSADFLILIKLNDLPQIIPFRPDQAARRTVMHDNSKPLLGFFVAILFVSCVFAFLGQSTRPTLADGAIVPQPVSYSPMDGASIPPGLTARTSKLRMACYPAGVGMHEKLRLLYRIL